MEIVHAENHVVWSFKTEVYMFSVTLLGKELPNLAEFVNTIRSRDTSSIYKYQHIIERQKGRVKMYASPHSIVFVNAYYTVCGYY